MIDGVHLSETRTGRQSGRLVQRDIWLSDVSSNGCTVSWENTKGMQELEGPYSDMFRETVEDITLHLNLLRPASITLEPKDPIHTDPFVLLFGKDNAATVKSAKYTSTDNRPSRHLVSPAETTEEGLLEVPVASETVGARLSTAFVTAARLCGAKDM